LRCATTPKMVMGARRRSQPLSSVWDAPHCGNDSRLGYVVPLSLCVLKRSSTPKVKAAGWWLENHQWPVGAPHFLPPYSTSLPPYFTSLPTSTLILTFPLFAFSCRGVFLRRSRLGPPPSRACVPNGPKLTAGRTRTHAGSRPDNRPVRGFHTATQHPLRRATTCCRRVPGICHCGRRMPRAPPTTSARPFFGSEAQLVRRLNRLCPASP
jgi:hypothetical protein